MQFFAVTDYDGCLIEKGDDTGAQIAPGIALILQDIQRLIPVIVVSARASTRAITAARRALQQANLANLPLFCRDMTLHDNSSIGITRAKEAAIRAYSAQHGAYPLIGIGDDDTDVNVYHSLNMQVCRLDWLHVASQDSRNTYYYKVLSGALPLVWKRIFTDIVTLVSEGKKE